MRCKRLLVAWAGAALVFAQGPHPPQDWTHYVRIAGHPLHSGNAAAIVDESEKSNVFGIEVDNDIPGRYESFLDPTQKLIAIRAAAGQAHKAGNKSFVYIAGWECITAHADRTPHSFYKDHPDWVQRQINGTPALFGGGVAFWIASGDEDVWVSPFPPEWRSRYMSIVRQIAATGIDGVYVDVPYWMTHFTGWEKTWASFDDYTVAAFKRRTGLDARTQIRIGDISDPRFRRWIDFRITAVTDFMKDVSAAVKSANPQCVTIAEIYPGIESDVPRVGADVYQLYPVVDAIAHEYQGPEDKMAASKSAFDWLDEMIGMFAFRSFAEGKATWMLNYSWDGEQHVSIPEAMKTLFAAQLTAGANSWDAKTHIMSGSNDLPLRTQIFAWIGSHEHTFYDPRETIDPIGVYFSPQTRNYFPDQFNNSFKGFMSLLLLSHREFQVVTPRTLSQFRGPLLIVPDARCLTDAEIAAFRAAVAAGHSLYITGDSGSRQSDGSERNQNPLRALGSSDNRVITWPEQDPGVRFENALRSSFAQAAAEGRAAGTPFEQQLAIFDDQVLRPALPDPAVSITAPPFVISQIARGHGHPYVFLDSFKGIRAKRNLQPSPETGVEISFHASAGARVHVLPYLGETAEIPAQLKNGKLTARIPVFQRSIVVWCQ